MLKVNVGLSRKLSKEFNSNGFTINLEGEVSATLDSPEKLLASIQEYYDLAEEALQRQIEQHTTQRQRPGATQQSLTSSESTRLPASSGSISIEPAENIPKNDVTAEQATNKQIQYLLNLGKRQGLNSSQLQSRIAQVLGTSIELYSLTKAQAGQVLNALMKTYTDSTAKPKKANV